MNRLNEDVIDCINSIEDPEDCAILGDEDMENALIDSDTEELPDDDRTGHALFFRYGLC